MQVARVIVVRVAVNVVDYLASLRQPPDNISHDYTTVNVFLYTIAMCKVSAKSANKMQEPHE